jgi:hypothetical protein
MVKTLFCLYLRHFWSVLGHPRHASDLSRVTVAVRTATVTRDIPNKGQTKSKHHLNKIIQIGSTETGTIQAHTYIGGLVINDV